MKKSEPFHVYANHDGTIFMVRDKHGERILDARQNMKKITMEFSDAEHPARISSDRGSRDSI